MALRVTSEDRFDMHVGFVACIASAIVCCVFACFFLWLFEAHKAAPGTCANYGWNDEGTGPFQHPHCVEREKPWTMHNPPEIKD